MMLLVKLITDDVYESWCDDDDDDDNDVWIYNKNVIMVIFFKVYFTSIFLKRRCFSGTSSKV